MSLTLFHSPGACSMAPHVCLEHAHAERMLDRPAVHRVLEREEVSLWP